MLFAKDGQPSWSTDPRQDSNIVYYSGRTHIAYMSNEGFNGSDTGGYIKVVTYDHATGQWLGPFKVSDQPVYDDHGYPVLAVDSSGYLHIVYDGHQIPLKYKRSLHPNDASAWTAAEQVGQIGTYPHLIVAPDNTLILFYRERGSSYDRWVEQMQTKPSGGGSWSSPVTILDAQWKPNDPANNYAVTVQSVHLGQDNVIYITWSWTLSGNPDTYYDVAFAKSADSGRTWTWANGTSYNLPIKRTGSYEKLWTGLYAAAETGLATNRNGQVVVLLYNYTSDWNNAMIYLRSWSGTSWYGAVVATGFLNAKIMIDPSGVAHGLAMTEGYGYITYMEARAPYTSWTFTDVGSTSNSFYPIILMCGDGPYFEGVWQHRIASDHAELYMVSSLVMSRRA